MAQSPAHRFGQIIGDVLERAIEPLLAGFAAEHGLFLDKKGPRPARGGLKVTWEDAYGNSHDLDYVLERGGTPTRKGTPVAFIESAWRSYTKHSRNKAQEIQGAILPLADKHRLAAPFTGVVLAGMFTEGSLRQLKSLGFSILFFSVAEMVAAFQQAGVNASFSEKTPDHELAAKVAAWDALPSGEREKVVRFLRDCQPAHVRTFMEALRRSVTRQPESVIVVPLHGSAEEWSSIKDAITFLRGYDETSCGTPFVRYNIRIRFNSGSRIESDFVDKGSAVDFLRAYTPEVTPFRMPTE